MARSSRENQRWLRGKNIGSVVIPPFAICCVDPQDNERLTAAEAEHGEHLYRVQLPDAEAVKLSDAGICFANSSQPIQPGKTGRITQDWPAVVLHDTENDTLYIGNPCGLVDGEGCVASGVGPFVCISKDPAAAIDVDGLETVLIAPSVPADRPFELSAELSGGAGSTADVKWLEWDADAGKLVDSEETGVVEDIYGNAWGLQGERGSARRLGDKWSVSVNPGQPIYQGTLAGDVTTTGNTNVSVSIGGNNRTLSAYMPAAPGSGKKWASGSTVYIGCTRGAWKIVSIVGCPVSV